MTPNTNQTSAIQSEHKKTLVVAGPGSGKTFVLCSRIMNLIENGIPPEQIICITFTNAAAGEINRRVGQKIGYVGTIHGFCLNELRRYSSNPILSIFPEDEKEYFIGQLIERLHLQRKTTASKVLKAIDKPVRQPPTTEQIVIGHYYKALREAGSIDFDQMLNRALVLFCVDRIREAVKERFSHLLVDEVQDCNDIDFDIFTVMDIENNFCVGDPDQSIFAFRGSNVDNIVALSNSEYWHTITLEDNYRSTPQICEAAQKLIHFNMNRIEKETVSVRDGVKFYNPGIKKYRNMQEEQKSILFDIKTFLADFEPEEMAILFRTNYALERYDEFLKREGIPTRRKTHADQVDGFGLAKLVIDWMANPQSDVVTQILLKRLHGEEKAAQFAREAASKMCSIKSVAFVGMADEFVIDGLPFMLSALKVSPEARKLVYSQLERFKESGGTDIADFSVYLRMAESEQDNAKGINLLTMHGAKGLEFKVVFLPGLNQVTIPAGKKDLEAIEEERRLLYVAMTRAKDYLIMSSSDFTDLAWRKGVMTRPSIFLREIKGEI